MDPTTMYRLHRSLLRPAYNVGQLIYQTVNSRHYVTLTTRCDKVMDSIKPAHGLAAEDWQALQRRSWISHLKIGAANLATSVLDFSFVDSGGKPCNVGPGFLTGREGWQVLQSRSWISNLQRGVAILAASVLNFSLAERGGKPCNVRPGFLICRQGWQSLQRRSQI